MTSPALSRKLPTIMVSTNRAATTPASASVTAVERTARRRLVARSTLGVVTAGGGGHGRCYGAVHTSDSRA
jgi:hypothetical protein